MSSKNCSVCGVTLIESDDGNYRWVIPDNNSIRYLCNKHFYEYIKCSLYEDRDPKKIAELNHIDLNDETINIKLVDFKPKCNIYKY